MQIVRVFIISLFSLVVSIEASGQSTIGLYKKIKKSNMSFKDYKDSTLLIKQKVFNRFTQETSERIDCFYFEDKINYLFSRVQENIYHYDYNVDTVSITYPNGDIFGKRALKPYNYDDHDAQNWFYSLKQVPTRNKGDFSTLKYGRPRISHSANDTMFICQYDRDLNQDRRLYFNSTDFRIYKVQYINDDLDRPDALVEFEFHYFKGNCYDSLMKVHSLGKYYNNTYLEKPVDDTKALMKINDSLFLLKDSVITGFSNKYILFDYWYLSCSPCIQMMPFVNKLHVEIDTSKVLIIGVNTIDDEDDIIRYKTEREYLLNEMDMKKMMSLHNLNEHPQLILVDKNLKDVKVFKGYGKGVSDLEIKLYLKSMNLLK